MLGRIFNKRYRLKEKIGSGGMADVFLADDQLLAREVAVKVLHPQYASDPAFIQRFRQEAQAAAALNHTNIVSIHDWGNEAETYYIVMEYVEGRDLKQILTTDGRFMPERAAEIGAEILSALQFAHRQHMIHRDIKPHNIIITPMGQVKVMDFGIARIGEGNGMTQTGTVMGTAQYISPEQAQGMPVDGRSDIYSLGVVLYELLTGSVPFEDENPITVAYKQVKEDPAPLTRIDPSLPPALEAIVAKSLAKNPDNRYQSAQEMKADLLRFLEGMPVSATPILAATQAAPAVSYRGYAEERRSNPWPWLIGVLIVMLVLGGIVAAFLLTRNSGAPVPIPSVIGQSEDEARRTLEEAGLKINVSDDFDYITSDDEEEGVVSRQDPDAGNSIRRGSAVDVVLTKAFLVPDVVDRERDEAERILTDAGLKASVTEQFSTDAQKNRVVSQDPAGEAYSRPGTTVLLVIGKGVEKVKVPNVEGKTEDEAVDAISAAGLKADVQEQSSDTVPEGEVMSQNPAADTEVAKGSTVTIRVSSGPSEVTVPPVQGMTEAAATSTLEAAGFDVAVQKVFVINPADKGKVVNQTPAANTKADYGSTVTIFVGQ
ncbi:MAG: Stk1 family PASTA domain-containing Ser/Thr kinase [Candidatus Geothermincolia bacterium]